MSRDYIPSQEEPFNEWQMNFSAVLAPNIAAWAIPVTAVDALTKQKADYEKAYAVANKGKINSRTREQVLAKNEATTSYKKSLRAFVMSNLAFNDLVTDPDRLLLGIRVRDNIRTKSGVPASVPDLFCTPVSGNRILVTVRQQPNSDGRSKRGKPADADGFQLSLSLGVEPAVAAEDCKTKILYKRSPAEIKNLPQDAGKILTVYARWIGMSGQLGQWSQGIEEVVPK